MKPEIESKLDAKARALPPGRRAQFNQRMATVLTGLADHTLESALEAVLAATDEQQVAQLLLNDDAFRAFADAIATATEPVVEQLMEGLLAVEEPKQAWFDEAWDRAEMLAKRAAAERYAN